MDCNRASFYDHLLTRKCSCGGDGQMFIDFVDDFFVRCAKCHMCTHAHIGPENAAKHWNDGDDFLPKPVKVFWDDPAGALQGQVVAIHVDGSCFWPVTQQSANFLYAIIEYADKMLSVKHYDDDDGFQIDLESCGGFNPEVYSRTIRPADGEAIRFHNIVFSEAERIARLEYRWGDTWLFICAEQDCLVLARDRVPYDEVADTVDGEYPLM